LSKSAILPQEPFENPHESGTAAWKQEVNQRLAAHRTRRGGPQDGADPRTSESPRAASGRAAEAAARVAARYAKAPSYSELLAGEARAVVRAAGAAAEAARNAQAAAQAVLFGLESGASELWEPAGQSNGSSGDGMLAAVQDTPHTAPSRWQDEPPQPVQPVQLAHVASQESAWAGAQPRWEEALPVTAPAPGRDVWSEMRVHPNAETTQGYRRDEMAGYGHGYGPGYGQNHGGAYAQGPEDGELFPFDAVASATVEPVQHLPANLIEFPRELIATRKARPRLAEGPFYNASQESPQLNIFEVDPALLAPPVYLSDTHSGTVAPPEWASIELDRSPEPAYSENGHYGQAYGHAPAEMPVHQDVQAGVLEATDLTDAPESMRVTDYVRGLVASVNPVIPVSRVETRSKVVQEQIESRAAAVELLVAPMSDRLLAGVVDGALVTLAFLAAAVVVIASTAHPPTGRIALIASGCGLLLFGMLYQFLFLSYAEEGTPGMRYARIALCTFDDDNPSREQMQQRIPALLMSALPVGLGLLWALFDGQHLGWHDRMTRTYQRKY
jgi:uncharacterized RDD family membrane protein YckC